MAIVFEVTGIKEVQASLARIEAKLPRAMNKGLERIAKFAANQYIKSAYTAGLRPSGIGAKSIFKDTRAVKVGKNWAVKMPIQGIYQDSMKPHWVSLKRGRQITKWAKMNGYKSWHIYTRPHPFFTRAESIIFRNVKPIMETEINRFLRTA